jgi:hypothetical protein
VSPVYNHAGSWRMVIILTVIVVLGVVGTAWVTSQVDEAQFTISCVSAQANVDQLTALREIADQLGVPVHFTIPEVPPECDGR